MLKTQHPKIGKHPRMTTRPPRTPLRVTRPGLVVPVRVDRSGTGIGPTKAQVANDRDWRRTSRGLYVPADVDATLPEQRIVEAGAVLPGHGGVTGWASLRWQGAIWFDGRTSGGAEKLPVDLAISSQAIRGQQGIVVCQEGIDPRDRVVVDGLPVTTAVRSAFFMMRHARNLRAAVSALDMAAYSDLVSIEEAWLYADAHPAWTGVPQAREAIGLADENAWSPTEVSTRLVWVLDAQLPRPLCNHPVFDLRGNHIGTPDLLDVEAGLVVEYDGALHLAGEQRATDVRRQEAFRRVGLEYLTVLSSHLHDRDQTATRMREVRRRALAARPTHPRWTIEPASWWQPTVTVEQRRALTEEQRDRWLGHRLRAS